ncbi:MAG TPA: sigma-54 dependent transcriptional regulator [candidate division Zixibacteria bacterium]|nr:sigma-54 dependent transcriptional regulator [candidate division Zixibacteria bacterium]
MAKDTILLVDDDPLVLEALRDLFSDDYTPLSARSGEEAVRIVEGHRDICVVVMDIRMPGMDGIAAARAIARMEPELAVIFHTGYPGDYDEHEIDEREAPYDYVEKGVSGLRLLRSVRHAAERSRLKGDVERLRGHAADCLGILGRSAGMLEVFRLIHRAGPSNSKVMILGETGTGKELVAKALHALSPRAGKPLAVFNCNHKSTDLVESELFGHLKGAFTGAIADRIGLFRYADGGTVFLDEIGDLDITTQAKLLRVLESGEFHPIGSPRIQACDVRVLCATHRDLSGMVRESKFREDLYYRLRGVEIRIPPLRERREDIPLLAARFLDRLTVERDGFPRVIDRAAMEMLIAYDWPGNVRQLLSTIESLLVLTDSELITRADIARQLGAGENAAGPPAESGRPTLAQRVREYRRNCIIEALAAAGGNISEAARILGVDRSNLRRDIQDLDIRLG